MNLLITSCSIYSRVCVVCVNLSSQFNCPVCIGLPIFILIKLLLSFLTFSNSCMNCYVLIYPMIVSLHFAEACLRSTSSNPSSRADNEPGTTTPPSFDITENCTSNETNTKACQNGGQCIVRRNIDNDFRKTECL